MHPLSPGEQKVQKRGETKGKRKEKANNKTTKKRSLRTSY
jgi:hypothetical protein